MQRKDISFDSIKKQKKRLLYEEQHDIWVPKVAPQDTRHGEHFVVQKTDVDMHARTKSTPLSAPLVTRPVKEPPLVQLGRKFAAEEVPIFYESGLIQKQKAQEVYKPQEYFVENSPVRRRILDFVQEDSLAVGSYIERARVQEQHLEVFPEEVEFSEAERARLPLSMEEGDMAETLYEDRLPFFERTAHIWKRLPLAFTAIGTVVFIFILGTAFMSQGFLLKGKVLGESESAYKDVVSAFGRVKEKDFAASDAYLVNAHQRFSQASEDMEAWSGLLGDISHSFPFLSPISSGKSALEAGKHLTLATQSLNTILSEATQLQNPFDENAEPLLPRFEKIIKNVSIAHSELLRTQEVLNEIDMKDIPEDKRDAFIAMKQHIPLVSNALDEIQINSPALFDLLGVNGPRKYLFLFQNNHEMRPTGGFIGSYGFLDIDEGEVRKFFVDGIYDPDGQLNVDVVPPKPIQKISAGWSLHDSNWFPDFPLSAEKSIAFYEKTGGPTVDGVIAITPEVLKRLLKITGPIYLEQYGLTIDEDNFIELIQQEVEVNYDKEENKPKQILADLAPLILDRVMHFESFEELVHTADTLSQLTQEKHILVYTRNEDIQEIVSNLGWSGELRDSPVDYLSVVHANINGYKTDGVIEESIEHQAVIQDDGSIINTVTITRKHTGGDTEYEWWNKVNANFMRVYVPLGSELISAEGHTREVNVEPLDYESLGFRRDSDVQKIEDTMQIDPQSGTRIFVESGKTVFGNWVYVSPKESVTVRYSYQLPFTLQTLSQDKSIQEYSILFQKQSGSIGADLTSSLVTSRDISWMYPEKIVKRGSEYKYESDLTVDRFVSFALKK